MPDTKRYNVYEYRIQIYKEHILDWITTRGTVVQVDDIDVVHVSSKRVDVLYICNFEESERYSVLHSFSNPIQLVDWNFLMHNKHILLELKKYYDKKHNKDIHK